MTETIGIARTDVGITPCVKYSCRYSDYCAESRAACSAFAFYVSDEDARAINPCLDIVHQNLKTRGKPKFILREQPRPTHEIYLRIYSGRDDE
jgi:hypothetical protein